jgi:hypothetical protein
LTLVVPGVGAPNDPAKARVFQVQTFLDSERNNWIFLSETGSIAVVPKTKEVNRNGARKSIHFAELAARKPGEVRTTPDAIQRHTISLKYDEVSDTLLYISDTGSIAAFHGPVPTPEVKQFPHIAGVFLQARKAGEIAIDGRTPKHNYEMFRDPMTNQIILIAPDGSLAIASGDLLDGSFKYSPYLHGYTVKVRRTGEDRFSDATRTLGIEATQERSFGLLVYGTERGGLVAVKGQASADPTQPLKWVTRLQLGVRRRGEAAPLPNDGRMGSVEVYRDNNTGHLLYISETGHIAVAPRR